MPGVVISGEAGVWVRRIFFGLKSGRGGQTGLLVLLKDGESILFSVLFYLQIVSGEETSA